VRLPVPPSWPPAPWTRVKGPRVAPPPQVAPGSRRKRGDAAYIVLTSRLFWTPLEALEDSWWGRGGRLLGLGHRGASVLLSCRHYHHRVRHHHHHHHHQSRRHHHHLGVISPRGTSSNNNNNNNSSSNSNNNNNCTSSGRPASRVAGKSRAPSKCGPFLHESNYHVDRS
jgi:hypothetical protein